MPRTRAHLGALAAARRGVVALEYAFVGLACMALVMGVMQIGFCLYCKATLNYVAAKTARQLQTGEARSAAAAGMPNFTTVTICSAMSGLLDCGAVTVSLYPVQDYLPGNSAPFDPGISKSLMLLRLTYIPPIPTWPLQVGNGGGPLSITASLPFVNEY